MGVVTKPPNLCIVTEYLQNGSLFDLLHKNKRDISTKDKVKYILKDQNKYIDSKSFKFFTFK